MRDINFFISRNIIFTSLQSFVFVVVVVVVVVAVAVVAAAAVVERLT